jgi:hypothetical protein
MLRSLQLVRGDLEGATAAHRRSAESARRSGFAILEAQALAQLASVEAFGGRDVLQAWRYLADSAAILRTTRTREILSYWLEFAAVALEWQHPDAALRAALAGDARSQDPWALMDTLLARCGPSAIVGDDHAG